MRVLTASHGGGEQRQDLFVQGGAARGGLRGEDVAGAQILREQIQRQTHHNSTGKRGGGAGLVLVIALQVAGGRWRGVLCFLTRACRGSGVIAKYRRCCGCNRIR